MKLNKSMLSISMLASLLAVTTAHAKYDELPAWVLNPSVTEGLAAVDCVEFSGNVSLDAKLASSNARLALAQQINTKVEGIDETFDSRTSDGKTTKVQTRFSSQSKQITKQGISGSKIIKSALVAINNKDYFCSMAVLNEEQTQRLFSKLLNDQTSLDKNQQAQLLKQFKSSPKVSESEQIESLIDNE